MYNNNPFYGFNQPNQPNPYQVIRVNGENGAKAYNNMPPNSSVLLLDETCPRVFLKQTDGASYPSIVAYKLEPWVDEKPVDYSELANRISKLEEIVNAKSNTAKTKPKSDTE